MLDDRLAAMLVALAEFWDHAFDAVPRVTSPPLYIISGQRSETKNRSVRGARDSRHLDCPSTAVDLRIGQVQGLSSDELWAILGGHWRLQGGRWGGTFSTPDMNHFDLG